jgi:hypothetical protein
MRKIILTLLFLTFNSSFANTPTPIWSETGHRAIGAIAQEHLTKKTKRVIAKLLDGRNLASVSNFGDEIKADTLYRKYSAWHYVNIPFDKKYSDIEPSKYGDLVVGIENCIAKIKDAKNAKSEKAFYLKMLVHLIGDLHQPMHVGRVEDKGGNDIQVQWFGNGSNLHKVWDRNLIEKHGMSYSELAESLPSLSSKQKEAIQKGDLLLWVHESQGIAKQLYRSVEKGEKLYYSYGYKWWPTLEKQLQKGGLRLAKVLNDLF